jgi:hypothetical protein
MTRTDGPGASLAGELRGGGFGMGTQPERIPTCLAFPVKLVRERVNLSDSLLLSNIIQHIQCFFCR